ncbi:MAG: metalloregulator ArsR/SmtB family transcription factor [Proteobacteria bacterium]|nr:metalloregulator ArsR/SmtB family transcription factor [Pseudomonadota bacterium]
MQTALDTTKALADGNRMRVIVTLFEHEELCVCQITELLRISMATVSRHMSILHKARLVQSRKDGRWVYYRLAETFPALVCDWLKAAVKDSAEIKADRLKLAEILLCDTADLCQRQKQKKRNMTPTI